MKILLTGANGYIGMRLLPKLLDMGHEVICAVRDEKRLSVDAKVRSQIEVVEIDFLEDPANQNIPKNIDAAYYLIHSMTSSVSDFDEKEAQAAKNFNTLLEGTQCKQVIYLSGIVNDKELSKHLSSRKNVEEILYKGDFELTVLRAGIIVGSGSSSFEIIRDLCEKLPVMITPKWVLTKTQPIAIRDVIQFLTGVLGNQDTYGQSFDIGGPDVITYKDMLHGYAKVRGFKNWIFTVPVMTPKLSSYWLYFVTSTSYKLAVNLVDSMKMEVVAEDNRLQQMLGLETHSYEEAIDMAFKKIEQNLVISSWKDSIASGQIQEDLEKYIQVPKYGVLQDKKSVPIKDEQAVLENIWRIGGETGWYYGNWLWKFRGFLDKLVGGPGLRRGRTHPDRIFPGDALDFWRVLLADKKSKRLLLFAEMKTPGEAWLEFKIADGKLYQTATFRPRGLWGRLYWYSVLPFHLFIFGNMIKNIAKV
ncbi:MAG: SDR family oxidoreductase [Allomuricauda sp.]|nr:SDR family oxidoreductase [Allomuricauda sp.]MBO6532982.1 SDR family oxidoreductase [Allomuricauda sp.]MBO6588464.1 SDR family oxidoreductase [Allomuricauda sp.]MBO6618396.1 SDR family oxidoreductase [Allomuricauda sp.]MBO6644002.1 SDR family oxidoreductase [Allomuricauda sp.]MBO6746886.1 SDR family oxidoreductase [Allomuricauda sp.]